MSEEALPILPDLTIVGKIGEGGMSKVYQAIDRRSSLPVAVKILKPEFAANSEDLELFAQESKTMELFNHPGIVKSHGLHTFEGKIYYIMELVDGYSYGAYINDGHKTSEEDCLLICESVACALDYAWNDFGIVHCDIKPDNIMINSEGIVKITDLGLSRTFKFLKKDQIDIPDHILGTPAYISPEQIFSDVELDCRSDIYSLAASLYHLCTRRVLFPGLNNESTLRAQCDASSQARDPRYYNPKLSEGFCQLLEVMLVKDRNYRLRTWKDVFKMARDVEEGISFKPRPTPSPSSLKLMR